eukprot:Skav230997  [mRNA]  locus=scaffold1822:174349:175194:- [translate_table: standard]
MIFFAWKVGSENQALCQRLQDGMEIAVACVSSALEHGYTLLLQRAWNAWLEQIKSPLRVPMSTLKASWFREELQFQRAMLLAWHKAVEPKSGFGLSSSSSIMPLKSSWHREDLQLQKAMLFGWHMAVLVSAYGSDLRLLQQRLESASSHIFRVTSMQFSKQLESSLRSSFLTWRVQVLALKSQALRLRPEICHEAEVTSESLSSDLSTTSQIVALRQVLRAWHRASDAQENTLNERSFMLRELNRLQEESRHRTIDMLDVMALSREAVALTEAMTSPRALR